MKIYISLPITGRRIEVVRLQAGHAAKVIRLSGHTPIDPLALPTSDTDYAGYMGVDISTLLRSDAIVFLGGWQESKGCQLEFAAAKIYGKKIFMHLGEIK